MGTFGNRVVLIRSEDLLHPHATCPDLPSECGATGCVDATPPGGDSLIQLVSKPVSWNTSRVHEGELSRTACFTAFLITFVFMCSKPANVSRNSLTFSPAVAFARFVLCVVGVLLASAGDGQLYFERNVSHFSSIFPRCVSSAYHPFPRKSAMHLKA